MRVSIHQGWHETDIAVTQCPPKATLGDLWFSATGRSLPAQAPVFVGGRALTAAVEVLASGLFEGAVVSTDPPDGPSYEGPRLVVTGGLETGATVALNSADTVVGRASEASLSLLSPQLSRRHLTLRRDGDDWRLLDTESSNGTYLDGERVPAEGVTIPDSSSVITAGDAALNIWLDPQADRPFGLELHRQLRPDGTVSFNRPPQPIPHDLEQSMPLPQRRPPAETSPLGLATVIAPLVLAGGMMATGQNIQFVLMSALMSPVLGVGSWFEQRRRVSRGTRRNDREFTEGLDRLATEIREAGVVERARRRRACPDPAEALRRAELPSSTLWHRRPRTDGFLNLHLGVGKVTWRPPVRDTQEVDPDVRKILDSAEMPCAPVEADLINGGVLGLIGDRAAALAVARSLVCQAAVQAGPADLTIGVFCDPGRNQSWDWAKWLPHTQRVDGAGQWLCAETEPAKALLRPLVRNPAGVGTAALLLVVDSDVLLEGTDSPARDLLSLTTRPGTAAASRPAVQVSGIVLAASRDHLPASCTLVVDVDKYGEAGVTRIGRPDDAADVLAAGLTVERARRCAVHLARFSDPERGTVNAGLPDKALYLPLLGLPRLDAAAIQQAWQQSRGVSAPIGVGAHGVVSLDLVADGPHGLVGGTTGSGKSEFLRSYVAGLAARNPPSRLTFILADFKGNATFNEFTGLPHTVGSITNFDAQLADRAIRALRAELHYRERAFQAAGAANLDAYRARNPTETIPRLLIVIDEFKILADEHPEVLDSFIQVATVGRTLGVHLILATQKPHGIVKDDILTNTNLRVALRVQSRDDSTSVIDVPDAAMIDRHQQGRAYIKRGHNDIAAVQTALITAPITDHSSGSVRTDPFTFGGSPARSEKPRTETGPSGPTQLDRLVEVIRAAATEAGLPPQRRPWPDPLPPRLPLRLPGETSISSGTVVQGSFDGDLVAIALADDPDGQTQYSEGWRFGRRNLLLLGNPGSGTTTTLADLALVLADTLPPEELELLVLDLGTGPLSALEHLPHTSGYVPVSAVERRLRLLRHLTAERERRRAAPQERHQRVVVLIDGLVALREELTKNAHTQVLLDDLYRTYTDGPDLNMFFAVASDRITMLPSAITETTPQKWLYQLADPYSYTSFNVPAKLAPPPVAGRAVVARTQLHIQVGEPPEDLAGAVARIAARWSGHTPRGQVVGQLPSRVTLTELGATPIITGEPWRIPVGVREADLGVAELELYESEHALITGPARSGKSSLLLAIAESLRRASRQQGLDLTLAGAGGRRSPLVRADLDAYATSPTELAPILADIRTRRTPCVLLIDDAELFTDPDQAIANLIAAQRQDFHIICAGRNDLLRSQYGHWTRKPLMPAGVLLQPDIDQDGQLFNANVPRIAPTGVSVGRGYLLSNASLVFMQAASTMSI